MPAKNNASIPALPNLWWGARLAIGLFILEIIGGVQQEVGRGTFQSQSAGGYAAALTFLGAIISTAYVLSCIAQYHRIVCEVDGWNHPISPRRAVRFHFIPLFNLYWDFKWPNEIARFVNWRTQRKRMSGALVGSLVLLGFLVGGFVDVSIGLAVILAAFAYISRCLQDAFSSPPVPFELHTTNNLDATSLANWST